MNWPTPKKLPEPWERQEWMPPEGAVRTSTEFAWLPVKCKDKRTRWLERVLLTEQFGKVYFGWRGCYTWGWKTVEVDAA